MIFREIKRLRLLPKSLKLSLAVFGTGIASGLVGILCHYLLEFIQVLSFGKDKGNLLLQFQSVSAFRRFLVLLMVGILASLFWYFLQRRVSLLSISKAKQLVGKRSPNFLGQSLHALVQVAIVAAGASIGKEGAPRELGALFGGSLSKGLRLDISDRQLLIAGGAGAGLASVYQVPFASALFVLETLGVSWKLKNIVIILVTTYVSAYCARPIVGGQALYLVDKVTIDSSSFMQAIILTVFATPLAMMFGYLTKKASGHRITDKKILWTLPFAFMILGGLSAYLPIFMGNGQVLAQWLFFWEVFSISSCHSHHQMPIGLSTFKKWCLWWNSDAIVYIRRRCGLSDNGAFWKFWPFPKSEFRNAFRSNYIFRNNFECPPNRNSLGCWFYRHWRSYRITTLTSQPPIKDN